jgi:hypothetical protein
MGAMQPKRVVVPFRPKAPSKHVGEVPRPVDDYDECLGAQPPETERAVISKVTEGKIWSGVLSDARVLAPTKSLSDTGSLVLALLGLGAVGLIVGYLIHGLL